MDKQMSKKTMYLHLIISSLLDGHLKELQESVDADEFDELRQNTGRIMGEINTLFLNPIWDKHAELKPAQLGGDFEVDDNVQRKVMEFVRNLLHE